MSGPVDLLVFLQLSGNSVRSSLLIFAVILAGLATLAAETPHDTPREGHARLALTVLAFHVQRSGPVDFLSRGGRGDGGDGGADGCSERKRRRTRRRSRSRVFNGDCATGSRVVVIVYNSAAAVTSPPPFKKRLVSRGSRTAAPVPRFPPFTVPRFRRSVRLGRAVWRARAASSARSFGRLTFLSLSLSFCSPLAADSGDRPATAIVLSLSLSNGAPLVFLFSHFPSCFSPPLSPPPSPSFLLLVYS